VQTMLYETRPPGWSFFELNADGPDMLFETGIGVWAEVNIASFWRCKGISIA